MQTVKIKATGTEEAFEFVSNTISFRITAPATATHSFPGYRARYNNAIPFRVAAPNTATTYLFALPRPLQQRHSFPRYRARHSNDIPFCVTAPATATPFLSALPRPLQQDIPFCVTAPAPALPRFREPCLKRTSGSGRIREFFDGEPWMTYAPIESYEKGTVSIKSFIRVGKSTRIKLFYFTQRKRFLCLPEHADGEPRRYARRRLFLNVYQQEMSRTVARSINRTSSTRDSAGAFGF